MERVYLVRVTEVDAAAVKLVDPSDGQVVYYKNRGFREVTEAEYLAVQARMRSHVAEKRPHGPVMDVGLD